MISSYKNTHVKKIRGTVAVALVLPYDSIGKKSAFSFLKEI